MNTFLFLATTECGKEYMGTLKAQGGSEARIEIERQLALDSLKAEHIDLFGVTSSTFMMRQL